MDDKEIRERIEAAQHRDRDLSNALGPELTAELENAVDGLLAHMDLVYGRLRGSTAGLSSLCSIDGRCRAGVATMADRRRDRGVAPHFDGCSVARAGPPQEESDGRTSPRQLAVLSAHVTYRDVSPLTIRVGVWFVLWFAFVESVSTS
jgi:hypothetical protein